MPRLDARWMIVEAIVEAASSPGISDTNERSIFSRSTGRRQSRAAHPALEGSASDANHAEVCDLPHAR